MPPEYSNVPELAYDWMIAAYFFLGGLSAGSFLFSAAMTYWKKEFRPLGKPAGVLAPVILALGMIVLLVDLGQPGRAWRLLTSFNPASAISWGVWFLNVFAVLSVLYAWGLIKDRADQVKKFACMGAPVAILVAAYTGVLLAQAPGRPLWHSALVPVLFLNGALASGVALGLLLSAGKQDSDSLTSVGKVLAGIVLLELGLIAVELLILFNGGGEAAATAVGLLTGPHAIMFLGVQIVLGMILPAAILLRSKAPALRIVASILVLIGVFAMRYVVVVGGQTISG